jgi:outer membrane protein assembly factor BamD
MIRRGLALIRRAHFVAGILCLVTIGCGGGKEANDSRLAGRPADSLLLDRGTQALEDHDWVDARGYFQQLLDTYPRSQLAGDARLGVADAYFHQKGSGNIILGIAEYRDFLTFFPNHPRADYAQYQVALGYYNQMHSSDRDQTPTYTAVREFEKLIELYRNSLYAEEGRKLLQECRDQLADAEFNVGRFYFKTRKHCRAAVARLKGVLENYPTYSHLDRVYFYLGQSHVLCGMPTEAMPYYQQLLDNYPESEHREEAEEVLSKLQEASVS